MSNARVVLSLRVSFLLMNGNGFWYFCVFKVVNNILSLRDISVGRIYMFELMIETTPIATGF